MEELWADIKAFVAVYAWTVLVPLWLLRGCAS
jgi:hypothetical protein